VQERGLIVIFALLQLLHLLRCGLPGSAFLCLNASFMPLLAPGLGIYMFKRVAHAMSLLSWAKNVPRVQITLLLVKNGLNY